MHTFIPLQFSLFIPKELTMLDSLVIAQHTNAFFIFVFIPRKRKRFKKAEQTPRGVRLMNGEAHCECLHFDGDTVRQT